MRRAGGAAIARDRVVGIVGTVVLVVALVGVVRFELSQRGGGFDVEFRTVAAPAGDRDGSLAEGATERLAFEVARANVTRMEWILTWGDDVGTPDRFNLTVTSPRGETRSVEGDRERLALAFEHLAVAPPPLTLAGSEATLDARLAALANRDASGTWSATVTLVRAGDQEAGGVALVQDPGNAWTLVARTLAYEARATPR